MTQVWSLLESLSLLHSALVLGMLELILLPSLLVEILGMLEPTVLTSFGSGFDFVGANPCTSEVHVLSMSEPFLLSFF